MATLQRSDLHLRSIGSSVLASALLIGVVAFPAQAELEAQEGYELVRQLGAEAKKERRAAAEALKAAADERWTAPIVDYLFYIPRERRRDAFQVLEDLTGESRGVRYFDWVELVGEREEIEPPDGYMQWKLSLLQNIDKRYSNIFYPGAPARIRLDEIVWGGVKLDGIPTLHKPAHVSIADAKFMRDRERVFGVSVGGVHRAYPVRVLSWHELLNDEIGGEPIALSYCTLCGSGIAYSTRTKAGGSYTFGTSGLLYRSNKLMFDHETFSLWGNLTGEPVVGRSANTDIKLPILASTLTTWKEWKSRHPDTTVMALDREMARRWGFDYQPGAAERARRGVSFPVWLKNDSLDPKEEVYAIRIGDAAKAYPLSRIVRREVINDAVGEVPVVLLVDEASGAVRVYERGDLDFKAGGSAAQIEDGQGRVWTVTEEALERGSGEEAESLARVPGHVAFWFGWYGFYPHTELYAS